MAVKPTASARVIERMDLTGDLMILKLEPSAPFSFKPGQYCTIGLDGTERPYSIVSAPHEQFLDLFIKLVPKELQTERSLTPRLWKLKAGDAVDLRPRAKGLFVLEECCDTQVMIATVTGIAPFISMCRARLAGYYKREWVRRWHIFQGASYQDEFGYFQELSTYMEEGIATYMPTVSRPQAERNNGWRRKTGRVNNIAEEELRLTFAIVPDKSTICYLCGNQGMVDDLGNKKPKDDKPLGKLVTKGFRVKEEVFF